MVWPGQEKNNVNKSLCKKTREDGCNTAGYLCGNVDATLGSHDLGINVRTTMLTGAGIFYRALIVFNDDDSGGIPFSGQIIYALNWKRLKMRNARKASKIKRGQDNKNTKR